MKKIDKQFQKKLLEVLAQGVRGNEIDSFVKEYVKGLKGYSRLMKGVKAKKIKVTVNGR